MAAILQNLFNVITRLLIVHMPMTMKSSKSKMEVEFQYSGHLFLIGGSIVVSHVWIEVGKQQT